MWRRGLTFVDFRVPFCVISSFSLRGQKAIYLNVCARPNAQAIKINVLRRCGDHFPKPALYYPQLLDLTSFKVATTYGINLHKAHADRLTRAVQSERFVDGVYVYFTAIGCSEKLAGRKLTKGSLSFLSFPRQQPPALDSASSSKDS